MSVENTISVFKHLAERKNDPSVVNVKNILENSKKQLDYFKEQGLINSEKAKLAKKEEERLFWESWNKHSCASLVATFDNRFKSFKIKFNAAKELDFVEDQILKVQNIEKVNPKSNDVQKNVHFMLKHYLKELEKIKQNILDEEKGEEEVFDEAKPLSFTMNRRELTLLFIVLKDSGLIAKSVSDYQLCKWLEKNTTYDIDKRMKTIKQEVSKFRNYEINNDGVLLNELTNLICETEINRNENS
jgi:hypothetical protein